MKASELRNMMPDELRKHLMQLLKECFNLRMQFASGQLGQSHLLRETRREIARVKTLMREKANGGSSNP